MGVDRRRWPAALLAAFPPLALLYVLAVRARVLPARVAPLVVLAALPLAAAAARPRGTLLVLAVLELVGAAVALAVVGFALAWRSG